MGTNTVTVEDIGRALAPVLKQGGAKRAILFGSYALGEADEWSDIDLLIVAESGRPFIERFKDFSGLRQLSPVKAMDVLVYTPSEGRSR
ncbi:MAG: nucleotidyltransferase domain-containing protein [Chloroflexota bacterium]|nr:nucleotidyltransferase domain-containing protein [Chloroflexota bacterium]